MPNPFDDLFGVSSGNPFDDLFGVGEYDPERRRRELEEKIRRGDYSREEGFEYGRLQAEGLRIPERGGSTKREAVKKSLWGDFGGGLADVGALVNDLAATRYERQAAEMAPYLGRRSGEVEELSQDVATEQHRRSEEVREAAEYLREDARVARFEAGIDSPFYNTLIGTATENIDALAAAPALGVKAARAGGRALSRSLTGYIDEAVEAGVKQGAGALERGEVLAARRALRPTQGESLSTEILPTEAMAHAGSASSPEAISRLRGGTRFYEVSPGGEVRPMIGVEAVDTAPRKGYAKVRISANGEMVVEEGRLTQAGERALAAEARQARPVAQVVDEPVVELAEEGDEGVLAALGVRRGAGVEKLAERAQKPPDEFLGVSGSGVAPEQRRPPWEMSSGELDEAIGATEASGRSVEESLFGVEGAKRYDRLHRKANSSYDRKGADAAYEELQRMESSLTEPQRNRLFGIGEDVYDGDELKLYREAISKVDSWGSGSPDELGASLQWAVTRLGDEVDPARMTLDERLAWVQMRRAFEVAQEKGWSTGDVSRAAYRHGASRFGDPSDVEAMFGRFRDPLGPSGPPAVRAARPIEAVESVAERGQRLLTQPPPPKLSPQAELSVKMDPEGGHVATEGLSDWLVKNFTAGPGSVDPRGNVFAMVARDFVDPRIRRYLKETLPRRVEDARQQEKAALREMAVLSSEIDQTTAAAAKVGWGTSAAQLRRQMDEARRLGDYTTLPPPLRAIAERTGAYIDNLSAQYVESGLARGETAETIANNLGRYLHTSHAAFDRPGFLAEVRGSKAWDEARAFFKSEIPDASEEEIVGLMEQLADRKQGRPLGFGKRGGVGRKDLTNLIQRDEIPEPVRELLGVYRDYRVTFERSTAKMSYALAEHRLLRDVAEELRRLGVVRDPSPTTGKGVAGYYREIVGGPERSPLAGLYTTPRVAELLEGVMEGSRSNWFTFLSGAVKFGKVAISPQTQSRNFDSGLLMSIANGNLVGNPKHLLSSGKAQAALIRQVRSGDAAVEREIGKAIELGVVGRGASSREFVSYMDEIGQGPQGLRRLVDNKPMGYLGRAYMAGDDFWKFANWKAEIDKLQWGYGGRVPREAIEREAAEIVSQQLQTYDRAIPIARKLSRNPLIGPFVTFHAEMPRNLVNILRRSGTEYGRAKEALAAGDPKQAARWASIASERLVGMGVALTLFGGYKTYMHRKQNLTSDKEEAFRRLALPDYAENSQAVIVGVDGDEVTYFDSQFADPYNIIQRMWVAAIARPGDAQERLMRLAEEMADTFVAPEVLAGTAVGVATGRDLRTDREITRSSRPPGRRALDYADYVRRGVQPGLANTAERIGKAVSEGDRGKVARELVAVVGPRWSTVNVREAFGRKVYEFGKAREEISADFRVASTDRSGNPKQPEQVADAQRAAEESWKRAYQRMQGYVTDARNWGYSAGDVMDELRERQVRASLARALVEGRYMSYQEYRRAL